MLAIYICYILLMKISSNIMDLLEVLTCRSVAWAGTAWSHHHSLLPGNLLCCVVVSECVAYLECMHLCVCHVPGVAATLK